MDYRNIDGRTFETKQEYIDYKQWLEARKNKQEELRREQLSELDEINGVYKKLEVLMLEYKKKFGTDTGGYFLPKELYRMLKM